MAKEAMMLFQIDLENKMIFYDTIKEESFHSSKQRVTIMNMTLVDIDKVPQRKINQYDCDHEEITLHSGCEPK